MAGHDSRDGLCACGADGRHLSIDSAVRVTERVASLPSVATLDWCDRAAQCLVSISGTDLVMVVIASVDPRGVIHDLEAVGLAASADDEATRERVLTVRHGADTLRSVGFACTPDAHGGIAPVSGLLHAMAAPADWREGPVGRLLPWAHAGGVVASQIALGDRGSARAMTVFWVPKAGVRAEAEHVHLLAAVMPLLARKALRAIGRERASRAQWLSPREQAVLELLTIGHSVREIADHLGRSPHTVHDHVKALHRKLNANSRGELVARALGHDAPAADIRSETIAETKPENAHAPRGA